MLLRLAVLVALLIVILVAYLAWRRPPRRLRRRIDLPGLGIRGPAIVQFTTPSCAPCKAAAPHLAQAADRAGVRFAQVDVAATPDVARSYGIRSVPTIAVTSSDGSVLGVWTSLPSNGELAEAAARARS